MATMNCLKFSSRLVVTHIAHGAKIGKPSRLSTSARLLQGDLIQDLYIKELKAYKASPLKASDADHHVQKFNLPTSPISPEESDIARDLRAYEQQEVEIEGQTVTGSISEEDWFVEEDDSINSH